MANKALLGALSALLVIAAMVGAVAVVLRNTHRVGSDFTVPPESSSTNLVSSSKSVASFCATTDYTKVCEHTLKDAVKNASSPKEVAHAVVKVTVGEIDTTVHLTQNLSKLANDSMNRMAFEDCKQLFDAAVDEVKAALAQTHDVQELAKRTDDIKTWLSAIISYQETCVDGITDPELKATMKNGLVNATQLTSNAIAIVKQLAPLLKLLDIKVNGGAAHRRLLEDERDHQDHVLYERDGNGYPMWLSVGDRKLLTANRVTGVKPNAVVAKDGSGDYKRIQDAVDAMPKNYKGRYVIYVKAGVYKEYVNVAKGKENLFMYGDGSRKTMVSGNKNFVDGYTTINTATFSVTADGFIAKSMGFTNTAGPEKHQAVALRVQSDKAVFYDCRMDAFQDTLYVHAKRQFYRNCVISGTVDFIFGDAAAVFQNCLILVRRPMDNQMNAVTAHGRKESQQTTGLVIHNCRILPDKMLYPVRSKIPTYLGRPWKEYARTVIMESTIGDLVRPEGWLAWANGENTEKCYYAEYGNRGPGAGTSGRVKWKGVHVISGLAAQQFTVDAFIQGNQWISEAGVPYLPAFRRPR